MFLQYELMHKLRTLKTYELCEDGQELRPKHVVALINKLKKAEQQVGVKFYERSIFSRKMNNIKNIL